MQQRVSLPASPAVARNLIRLAQTCRANIDPALMALAERDQITDEAWQAVCPTDPPLPMSYRDAVQFAIDHELRAVIPEFNARLFPGTSRLIPLLAAKITDVSPIVIVSESEARGWHASTKAAGINAEIVDAVTAADEEFQRGKRDGLLIISWERPEKVFNGTAIFRALACEWSRTLVYGNPLQNVDAAQRQFSFMEKMERNHDIWHKTSHLSDMASVLHPVMPTSVLVTDRHRTRKEHLVPRGFLPRLARDTAFLCSVWAPP